MNFHIELAKHEIKRIDDTVLVHNLDNNTVVQLNGTGSVVFLQLSQMNKRLFSMNTMVAAVILAFHEMAGREQEVEEDIKCFMHRLYQIGLMKSQFPN